MLELNICRAMFLAVAFVLAALVIAPPAHAHLMVAQHGTLHIVGDSAYLALSLPVSAFNGFDDDGDGFMSPDELRTHRAAIEAQVRAGIGLYSTGHAIQFDGLMINLPPPDNKPAAVIRQVEVLGRFTLFALPSTPAADLALRIDLFGTTADARRLDLFVTRHTEKQLIRFQPGRAKFALLPSNWSVFGDYVWLGAEHIVTGLDHLLFLLVVVSAGRGAGWSLSRLMLALTCFTVGHACTLTASLLGDVSVSPAIVEPAIAATIVTMALFDVWAARQAMRVRPLAIWIRFALIFSCALIHGLGLADALTELGLDSTHRILSLAGFNIGIELAQVGIAGMIFCSLTMIRKLEMPSFERRTTHFLTSTAVVIGAVWFVQRLVTIN